MPRETKPGIKSNGAPAARSRHDHQHCGVQGSEQMGCMQNLMFTAVCRRSIRGKAKKGGCFRSIILVSGSLHQLVCI